MGKIKAGKLLKGAGKLAKGIAKATPLGRAASIAGKVGGAAAKLVGLRGGGARRRSRGLNINKYVKKITKAKLDAKLMKIKLSALKGI